MAIFAPRLRRFDPDGLPVPPLRPFDPDGLLPPPTLPPRHPVSPEDRAVRKDVRSANWDGGTDLSNIDTTATKGYFADYSAGAIQIAGTLYTSGTVNLADGTAAAPSLTFSSDTNTGPFLVNPDVLGLSAGGKLGFRLNGTGGIELHGIFSEMRFYSRDNDDQHSLLWNSTGNELRVRIPNTDVAIFTSAGLEIVGALSGLPWQTWTPTFTNFTLGNGTVVARYVQIGKFVGFYITFTLGSTSAVDSSGTFSTPVTAHADYDSVDNVIGLARYKDATGSNRHGFCRLESTTTIRPVIDDVTGTYPVEAGITATVPITWTTSDEIYIQGFFRAA